MEELRKIRKRKVTKENTENFENNFKKILVGNDGDSDMYYFQCLHCTYSLFSSNNIILDKQDLDEHTQKFHQDIWIASKKAKSIDLPGM